MRTRPRPGDIVEVATPLGFGYVQYVDRNRLYGALLRVLPGVRPEPALDPQGVADQGELYRVFFPLGAALHRRIFAIVGAARIPDDARAFAVMRSHGLDREWEAERFWLWDGVKTWRVGRQDPLVPDASPKETWNDTVLIERIALGWTPRADFDPNEHDQYVDRRREFEERFGAGPY